MRQALAATVLLLAFAATPAMGEEAQNTAPAAATQAAHRYSTETTPIGDLVDNPAAREVLVRHIPNLVNSPSLPMIRGQTLKALQGMTSSLPDSLLAAIDADLALLPAH